MAMADSENPIPGPVPLPAADTSVPRWTRGRNQSVGLAAVVEYLATNPTAFDHLKSAYRNETASAADGMPSAVSQLPIAGPVSTPADAFMPRWTRGRNQSVGLATVVEYLAANPHAFDHLKSAHRNEMASSADGLPSASQVVGLGATTEEPSRLEAFPVSDSPKVLYAPTPRSALGELSSPANPHSSPRNTPSSTESSFKSETMSPKTAGSWTKRRSAAARSEQEAGIAAGPEQAFVRRRKSPASDPWPVMMAARPR
jgi:hypothetical protein